MYILISDFICTHVCTCNINIFYYWIHSQSNLDPMDGEINAVFGMWRALQALQMEAVTLVLIASLVAHLYFWPYQAAWPSEETVR